ncbi:MAG: topoisomerase IV [Clostridiales bacterium]|jgi:DNA gyrase subunit A|nr:topoisomerase IV [Clostridiales bacterium]
MDNVTMQPITDTLELNYMPYAMSVIVSRAIPEIDGFKPAHRKLLFTMYKMGLLTGARIKSADVVGQTMRLHPHGDGPIYETLVRLTRGNDALLHPFIDSKGNFGKQYSRDMAYAASRYTEVKLDEICTQLFSDIDKDTVDFIDNYNGSMKEPVLFPSTFPNILVTSNQGIAVGMASSICSFNLKEVCAATIKYIEDKDCDISEYLLAPDFSTGGDLLYNKKDLDEIYATGRGGIRLRAKYRYDKKNSCVEVFEIPYTTTIEAIIDKIIALTKANKIRDITDVRDETDLNGLKIAIDIKRSANPDIIMHKLYGMTTLSDTFSCNFNILVDGHPYTMGIKAILDAWLNFRRGCITRQLIFDISKKEERLHLLLGLSKLLLDIDKAIRIIRNTEEDARVIPNLMDGFDIDKPQAEFIAEIKLRNLNKEYLLKQTNELDKLKKEIENLRNTLSSEKKINKMICAQLKVISEKYGKPRRTNIVYEEEMLEIPEDNLIDDYALKLFLTEHGYFKKISLVSLRSSGGHNVKEDDRIIQELETSNRSDVLFFSQLGNVYKARAYEFADSKASSLGEYLSNVLELAEGEKIIYLTATSDYTGFMIFAFENGKIAKVSMDCYATKNRKKLINAYSLNSPLIFIQHILNDTDLLAVRDTDKATLFDTSLISLKATKQSNGIQVYSLKKNSRMTQVIPLENFVTDDPDYYRTTVLPSTGHFITERDKAANIKIKKEE